MNRSRYNGAAVVESTPEQEAAVAPYKDAEVPIPRQQFVEYGGQDQSFIVSLADNAADVAVVLTDEIKAAVAPYQRKLPIGVAKDHLVMFAHHDRAYLDGLGHWAVVDLWKSKFFPNSRD